MLGLTTILVIFLAYACSVQAQQLGNTVQMQHLVERLESNTDRCSNSIDAALDHSHEFRNSFDAGLDRSRIDGSLYKTS